MRKLSKLEKNVAKVLLNHSHVTEQGMVQLASVVDGNFIGESKGISLLLKDSKVSISIPEKNADKLREKFILVISIFSFFEYLAKEGLIIFVGEEQAQGALGEQYNDGKDVFIPYPLSTFLLDNFTKYILVTEEFRDIVNSNFKDHDQVRHQQNTFISVIALIVSISLGLYGVFSSYSNGKISDGRYDEMSSRIDDSTIKIESALNGIKAKSDYLRPLEEINIKVEDISNKVTLLSKKDIVVNCSDARESK
ncbi:TPA: hypothetical protein ACGUZ0_004262 [Vibrio vulnificus]